jgi:hypothetical protein
MAKCAPKKIVKAERISDTEVVIDRTAVETEPHMKVQLLGPGKPPAAAAI